MVDNLNLNLCTGCEMCGDICPQNAITFHTDEQGFWHPLVDHSKCIDCGLCIKKCPVVMEESYEKHIPYVYAAWTKNDKVRLESTSGGVYYELAKAFIEENGYIVGAVYDDDWKGAHHIIGHSLEDLNRIMGSKYFQSDAKGIYKSIKQLLDQNQKVLFCGCPCQSAALQSFLGRDYENLFTVDFICRGINSPLAFRAHIEELEKEYGAPVTKVHLKDKTTGWSSLATYVEFANGKCYHADRNASPWVKGFVGGGGLYIRESCYNCRYRGFPRISDISIGDFWGIHGQSEDDMFKGISCLLVNSYKGEKLLQMIEPNIHLEARNFDELCAGNPALKEAPERNEKQKEFFKILKDHKFSEAVKLCQPETSTKITALKKWIGICKRIGRRVLKFIHAVQDISIYQFIKWNYFSKNIIRDKGVFLIPYKNAVLDLSQESRIYIHDRNLEIGINKLKKSRAETHIRMDGKAVWECHGCGLFYNTVLEIKEHARFESGFFTANGGSVILCHKHIVFGEDVMLGRNIVIYDSDFHQVYNNKMEKCNPPRDVIIENHVWLTSNINVLKGVCIGHDSLITPQTVVRKSVPPHSLVAGNSKVIGECKGWSRKMWDVEENMEYERN